MTSDQDYEHLGKDLERVGALVQGFYKHRQQINNLLPLVLHSMQRTAVPAEVMAAAWIGFSMARIWPEKPRCEESDMPIPETEMLEGLTCEQQQFVAFSYGVLGGITPERPVSSGPLSALTELVISLAPLVVIPAEAIATDGTVSNNYLLEVAAALGLSLPEIHRLLTILGMAKN